MKITEIIKQKTEKKLMKIAKNNNYRIEIG